MIRKMAVACVALVLVTFTVQSSFAENATREEVVANVKAAVKMATDSGMDATIVEINNPDGKFVWKDSYVFATTPAEAIVMAHPVKPKLIGKNLLHVKDINGVMLFAEIANVGKSDSGQGWIDYMWPRPGEKKPTSKHTYVEKVPGQELLIGGGYYD